MMTSVPVLVEGSVRRFALPLLPQTVRAVVAAHVIGAYLLLQRERPIYVGRSDSCVRTRLATHPLLGIATHFLWEPCQTSVAAFSLESQWYHRLYEEAGMMNLVHPASPEESRVRCPFCNKGDIDALSYALVAERTR